MESLNRAMDLVSRWKADRNKQRAEIVAHLEGVIAECQAAAGVWQEILDAPGAPGTFGSLVMAAGPDRARQLHEINLRARARVAEVCRLAGPAAGRFVALEDEDVTGMAYRQLVPGEGVTDAARAALQSLQARADYLRGLIERARRAGSAVAEKRPAKKSAGKGVKKKSAKKKAAGPAKKKAAPKKK